MLAWEEEQVEERRMLLLSLTLHVSINDQWFWIPAPTRGYTVRGTHNMLTTTDVSLGSAISGIIWSKLIPLMVFIFAWRLLRNRLPTKDNPFQRGIVYLDSQLCVSGCRVLESTQHLFMDCSYYGALWHMMRDWLGFDAVDPLVISDQMIQFSSLVGFSKLRCFVMLLIWFACIWVL